LTGLMSTNHQNCASNHTPKKRSRKPDPQACRPPLTGVHMNTGQLTNAIRRAYPRPGDPRRP